jgi:hypothetical protein
MDEDQNDGNGDDDATLVAELNEAREKLERHRCQRDLEVKPAPST